MYSVQSVQRQMLLLGICLGWLSSAACGPDEADEVSAAVFKSGYQRFQSDEAAFLRRCVTSKGNPGTRVAAAVCSELDEGQGFKYDSTTTRRLWIVGQTTGAAKCLAATAAGTVVAAACAENAPAMQWTRGAVVNTKSTFSNAGKCLTLAPNGALTVAPCVAGARRQLWGPSSDATLIEALGNGALETTDVPTVPPDLVIPASAETFAETEGIITHWDLTYIKYMPAHLAYASIGILAVARDEFNGPLFLFRSLHIYDPTKPQDVDSTWIAQLPLTTTGNQSIRARSEGGAVKGTITNTMRGMTAHMTALAMLRRDVQAFQASRVAPRAATDTADVLSKLFVSDYAPTPLQAIEIGGVIIAGSGAGAPAVAIMIAGPLLAKTFPDNPPKNPDSRSNPECSMPSCASRWVQTDGSDCGPRYSGCGPSFYECGVQASHPLLPIPGSFKDSCAKIIPAHPGYSCSKHPLNKAHTWCQFDCLQQRTDCLWNWCLLPSKRS